MHRFVGSNWPVTEHGCDVPQKEDKEKANSSRFKMPGARGDSIEDVLPRVKGSTPFWPPASLLRAITSRSLEALAMRISSEACCRVVPSLLSIRDESIVSYRSTVAGSQFTP